MTDLAVIVVSTNEAHWLRRCLPTIFEHAGGIELDVVVVDNESTDETREFVESEFPMARVVQSVNRGFAQANNCALARVDANGSSSSTLTPRSSRGLWQDWSTCWRTPKRRCCRRPPGSAGRAVGSNDSTLFDSDSLVLRGDRLREIPIQGVLAR